MLNQRLRVRWNMTSLNSQTTPNLEQGYQKYSDKSVRKQISPLDLATIDNPYYLTPSHLELLNDALLKVAYGNTKRLMVFMPPRHGKSETISKYFTAWYIGTHPNHRVILTSYEADFAATWGYKSRNVLDEHHTDFNINIDKNSKARNRWDLLKPHQGGMMTAGVGGPITGKGANVLIIDDPVKNADEANSQTMREKAWDWYNSTAYTRLEPDGIIILIMTRWHEDDLGGRLLDRSDEDWTVLELPAINNKGKALWPDRYPLTRLEEIKTQIGSYWFNALYQQHPLPDEGGLFKRDDFKTRHTPPNPIMKVRMWDTAATPLSKGKDPDYTNGLLFYNYSDGTYQVADNIHVRVSPLDQEKLIVQTAHQDGHDTIIRMFRGVGDTGIHQIHTYTKLLAGFNFKEVKEDRAKDSPQRIGPLAAQVEAGNVFLRKDANWINDLLDEASTFPHGKHDDIVDCLAGAFKVVTNVNRRRVRAKSLRR